MEAIMLQFKKEGRVVTIILEEEPKEPETKCSLCGVERDKSKRATKLSKPDIEDSEIGKELIRLITTSDSVCAICRASMKTLTSDLERKARDRSPKYNGPFLEYVFPRDYLAYPEAKMYYVIPTDNGDFERKLDELGPKEFDRLEEYAEWNRIGAKVYEKYEERAEIAEQRQFDISARKMIADGEEIKEAAAKFFLNMAKRRLKGSSQELK
jgi:hypothetical protein